MSATVLMIILIGGGAIAFYVRFLIALHKESRSRIREVKKVDRQVYEFMTQKPDRKQNPVWTTKWPRRNVWHA